MPYIAGKTVVHYVRRWSGKADEEDTLCGSDSSIRTEAGGTHDSQGGSMNICEECAKKVQTCTRKPPHVCKENGPCNGWPKD